MMKNFSSTIIAAAAVTVALAGFAACSESGDKAGHDDHPAMDHGNMDHGKMDHAKMDHGADHQKVQGADKKIPHNPEETAVFDGTMAPILASYLKIQETLAADSIEGVVIAAKAIAAASAKVDAATVKGEHKDHYKNISAELKSSTTKFAAATTIETAREAFKNVSKPMAMWGSMSQPKGIDVVYCSMAEGSWLQKKGEIRNPYYGATMLTCGDIVGGAAHAAGGEAH